jgi:large subunit ribosomal protein L13e
VDHRRKNRSLESLQLNVQRLKEYKSKLIIFPKNANKPKAGDADASAIAQATQLRGAIMPIAQPTVAVETRVLKETPKVAAYATLRNARAYARYKGMREKAAKLKAEEEKAKK